MAFFSCSERNGFVIWGAYFILYCQIIVGDYNHQLLIARSWLNLFPSNNTACIIKSNVSKWRKHYAIFLRGRLYKDICYRLQNMCFVCCIPNHLQIYFTGTVEWCSETQTAHFFCLLQSLAAQASVRSLTEHTPLSSLAEPFCLQLISKVEMLILMAQILLKRLKNFPGESIFLLRLSFR